MTKCNLPTPKGWDRFEDMVWSVFTRRHKNPNLQRFGRQGQKQYGVDIAGPTLTGFIGIQCKHHPGGELKSAEVDSEIGMAEAFRPKLAHYYIVTSAPRDAKITRHVFVLSEARVKAGKFPVSINFWEELEEWLSDYPDLLHKYYPSIQPQIDNITLPGVSEPNRLTSTIHSDIVSVSEGVRSFLLERGIGLNDRSKVEMNGHPVRLPTLSSALEAGSQPDPKRLLSLASDALNSCTGIVNQIDPYRLSVGLSTLPDRSFDKVTDLDLNWSHLFSDSLDPSSSFGTMRAALEDVRGFISIPAYDREVTVYLQARLGASFLLGWAFRQVTGFHLNLVFRDTVWPTNGVSYVSPGVTFGMHKSLNSQSDEGAVVLSISRDIGNQVETFLRGWPNQPRVLVPYRLASTGITSAAHALSIANELARNIKCLADEGGFKRLHLFGAMPAALAALVSYHLNALCPITLYFANEAREFKIAGQLSY